MRFTMPYGGVLDIRASREVDDGVEWDRGIDGVTWQVWWNGKRYHWECCTKAQAIAIALGAQWGVREVVKWAAVNSADLPVA